MSKKILKKFVYYSKKIILLIVFFKSQPELFPRNAPKICKATYEKTINNSEAEKKIGNRSMCQDESTVKVFAFHKNGILVYGVSLYLGPIVRLGHLHSE